MRSPTVAYLVKRFPRLSETFVLNEILEIRRQGLKVQLYALEDPREAISHPEAESLRPEVTYLHDAGRGFRSWRRVIAGASIQALTDPRATLRLAWTLLSVNRSMPSLRHALEALWLARDLRRRGISHIHAHFAHSPAAVAYMVNLISGIPFSFTAHAKDLYTTLPRNLRIRCRAASFVVTCTEFNGRHLEDLLEGGAQALIHIVYHGTDLSRFTPSAHCPQRGQILSVGRLVPKKGYSDLIGALGRLQVQGIPFECDIFGGGPMRASLTESARSAGLGGRVRFHGPRLQQEVIAAYRSAAVFVLAPVVMEDGDRDGIPNVLVEAMACGVPVVSTRISGIPELIEDGVDGLLVDPGDEAALAAAIQRLLEGGELAARIGRAGRRKVEQRFDLVANSTRLVQLFNASVPEQLREGVVQA